MWVLESVHRRKEKCNRVISTLHVLTRKIDSKYQGGVGQPKQRADQTWTAMSLDGEEQKTLDHLYEKEVRMKPGLKSVGAGGGTWGSG